MKSVIVTGAAGFTGGVLTEMLREKKIEVYAVVRPGSDHNIRLDQNDTGLHIIELDADNIREIPEYIKAECDVLFHLLWTGEKSIDSQIENVDIALGAVDAAKSCGCRRIVITGSQAEYGVVRRDAIVDEEYCTRPVTAYGAAKVSTCHLTRIYAKELGIEWIWGRIFSLIGKYEPRGRMLPDLYDAIKTGREMTLSSCEQSWDYLDVHDAAAALIQLGERGKSDEIYNIASGDFKPLKEYTKQLRELLKSDMDIHYGCDPNPFISLRPSVEKLKKDTGWKPSITFEESVADYEEG